MVENKDVRDLLSTGTWTTQRAKSPRPLVQLPDIQYPISRLFFARPSANDSSFTTYSPNPVRANQSSKLERLDPRDSKIPGTGSFCTNRSFPPPPSVEDEEVSLAKEWLGSVVGSGDEEPKCRGTVEQLPILLPVPEHNTERRFVLFTAPGTDEEGPGDNDGSSVEPPSKPHTKTEYAANTKIQLTPKADKDAQPELQRRRSRADLPRLETDMHQSPQPRSSSRSHRTRSAAHVDPDSRDSDDYFSPHPESARPAGDAFLSPVIKHATKGRDRAYWNFNPGSNVTGPRGSPPNLKPHSSDGTGLHGYARTPPSGGPGAPRRLHSDLELPRQTRKPAERHNSYKDESHSRSRHGPPSPILDRRQSPPRLTRTDSSPARRHAEPSKPSRSRSNHHGRSSPPRGTVDYSSDEYHDHHRTRRSHRHRRKSTVIQEDRPDLLSPVESRSARASRSRSRPPSPSPSPKSSQTRLNDYESHTDPRHSATHIAQDRRRYEVDQPVSPISSGPPSPRSHSRARADDHTSDVGQPRASSRTPSSRYNASNSKSVITPSSTVSMSTTAPLDDRKWQPVPPSPTHSRQGSFDKIPQSAPCWQPDPFHPSQQQHELPTPRHSATDLPQVSVPVISLRRYSEDVNTGSLPGLPHCPRQQPRAGLDWYTLPRYDNLNICPSCYEKVFYPTQFRDLFVPASSRSKNKETSCDLGTSPWYRIAWLMTRKYRLTDLHLIQRTADISAKHPIPCVGPIRVTRLWHSIIDPKTRRFIPDFTVCGPCAESVQALFPTLTGVFVALDRPAEPRSGKCSLHFTPKRNRFLTYFDVLESTHDHAMATGSAPSIQRLAEKIAFWSEVEECPREEPQRNQAWYMMAHIPDMTVCEECFLEVVYPELKADLEAAAVSNSADGQAVNMVVKNFYQKPHILKHSTVCLLASPRMREQFRRACRRKDGIDYLDSRVRERLR